MIETKYGEKANEKRNQIPFLRVENWGVLEAGFGGLLVQVASVSRVSGLHGSAAGGNFLQSCLSNFFWVINYIRGRQNLNIGQAIVFILIFLRKCIFFSIRIK